MDALSIMIFYLSLVFGVGYSAIIFFRIGRFGLFQISQILTAQQNGNPLILPRESGEEIFIEDVRAVASIVDIPTSMNDFIWSIFGFNLLKRIFDLDIYFLRRFGHLYLFPLVSMFGNNFGILWLVVGLPTFIADLILTREGYDYSGTFMRSIGIDTRLQASLLLGSVYCASYAIGRVLSSPVRQFNEARRRYENIVANNGYWFDNIGSAQLDIDSANTLKKVSQILVRLYVERAKSLDAFDVENCMAASYQAALVFSTLGEYVEAKSAIKTSRSCNNLLQNNGRIVRSESERHESLLLFLEGEIALASGENAAARSKFLQSKQIDQTLHDNDGIAQNDKRLNKT